MTAGQSIDYEALAQDAMRGMVRTVLVRAAKTGLPGEHHFYIAFDTQAPGVGLSRRLKEKYPEEMTIVLQHRFWDLAVSDERFEVKLTFDGIPERLVVPFTAIRVFFDPSVRYTLQFDDPRAIADAEADGDDASPRKRGGNGLAGARSAGDRRPRVARKPKADKSQAGHETSATGADDSPAPSSAQITTITPAERQDAADETSSNDAGSDSSTASPPQGGAQVFRIDQFRKK